MYITAAGALAGAAVTLIYIAAGSYWLQAALKWRWIPIAERVAGSWVAAISTLLIALAVRTGN